jgi:hypothetical protein
MMTAVELPNETLGAVNRNIAASATRPLAIHESSNGTNAKPRDRKSKHEPNSTRMTAMLD